MALNYVARTFVDALLASNMSMMIIFLEKNFIENFTVEDPFGITSGT